MTDVSNTLAVQAVAPTALARSSYVATSVRLATLQHAIVVASGGGPEFRAGAEPLQDGVGYPATDGVAYYRPLLRVASRPPGRRPGPDVWFLQDDQDVITLQWTLEAVPLTGGPAGAKPLPITVDSVRLVWDAGSYPFQAPGIEPVEGAADGQPALRIGGGARLRPDEAAQLEAAMNHPESACRLEVTYSYAYTVQVPQNTGIVPPRRRFPIAVGRLDPRRLARLQVQPAAFQTGIVAAARLDEAEPAQVHAVQIRRRINPAVLARLADRRIVDVVLPDTRPEARKQTVTRSVPFVFEPREEANGPIYRALHDAANLTDDWTQLGDAGWLRDADFPNTVFRLPDDLRLAWDSELGGPHMVPTLYRDAEGNARVRLLLRLAPWQDPTKIVLTRQGVDMPAARVVVGQVDSSTLRMGGAFPEELKLVGDGAVSIPLGTGAELALDVSLSFYEFVCQVVARPEGLGGRVDVVVGVKPASGDLPAAPRTVPIPVTIRLDRVDDLPCVVAVPKDVVSPTTVTVTNIANAELSVGGCVATFLQVDEESVVPVDTYPARCTTAFPVTIPAGGSVELAFVPETPADDIVWNGVQVELLDKRLTAAPAAVLRRIHELAAPGDLTRDLTVTSPVFAAAELPARWAALASIEVEVTTSAGTPTSVVLSKANPARTMHTPTTLGDLVAGGSGGIPTVAYRVRNNYVDHQGRWGAAQQQSGEEIVVYPNPPDGD